MIKWLSGSRLKESATVHEPTPLTNDPLAVISGINCPDGKYHIYAVSRVNPLYKEEEHEEEEETTLDENSDGTADQRSSPRKSVSSGYESRCNSSSESSSCTECENEIDKKSINTKREKRITKSLNNKNKKKTAESATEEYDKPGELKDVKNKYKNGSPPGSSNLSPIPEGKVDCSIPPPIWPRCEENCSHRGGQSLDDHVPGRTFFHDGTTNPVNFVFKYNEGYPRCSYGAKKVSVSEYERNWKEFTNRDRLHGKGVDDSGKGSTPESTMENRKEFTHEVLRDLANLIAYAMSKTSPLSIQEIMKTLSESIQKSLEVLSQTESDDSIKKLCSSLSYKNGIDTRELAAQLQKLKDRTYSSGSERNSSSSSGCKDIYISSNSSSKDGVYSSSSSVHERQKIFHRDKPKEKVIHHQRDCSSSSAESAFGYSDSSPTPPSDSSSSGKASGLLNPVFIHEDIYSVPKSVRNTIICDTLNRTNTESIKNNANAADCGSSAFAKLISAKRKISIESRTEDVGPLKIDEEEGGGKIITISTTATSIKVDNTVFKKVEHPYYTAMGRPDFTLDLPQAERLMKKIASSKRRRCWCRLTTSILGLIFFLLSVMMVSLVITKGRRMFGAI